MENENWKQSWPETRDRILRENSEIKPADLNGINNEEELLIQLQEKLKKTKKEIRNWLQFLG